MDRTELGLRLQSWHSSMHDSIYAVGSFYFAGEKYPRKEIVEDCIINLKIDIEQRERMLRGEKVRVYNTHYSMWIEDLREFAGYDDDNLKTEIQDLQEIVSEVEKFLAEDYSSPKVTPKPSLLRRLLKS